MHNISLFFKNASGQDKKTPPLQQPEEFDIAVRQKDYFHPLPLQAAQVKLLPGGKKQVPLH